MPQVRVNGVNIFYEETGSGPEAMVFSHSYLLDHAHFRPQMEHFQDRYRCLAYDHRGHGQSEATPDGYDMENLYADAVAFIEAMNCAPCHWVGLSTGGFIGLRLGLRRPDLVKSLILMDTSADEEPQENLFQYKILLWVFRLLGPAPILNRVTPIFLSQKFLQDPARKADLEDLKRRIKANNRLAVFKFGQGIFSRQSVQPELGRIKTPTLVMVGEEDVPTPKAKAERIAQGIPGARLVVVPEAGHISTLENPAAVNAAMEEFLAGLN